MWNPALLDPNVFPAEVAAHFLLGAETADPILKRCRVAVARAALEVGAPPGPAGEAARAEVEHLTTYLNTLLNSGVTVRVDVRLEGAGTAAAIAAVLLGQVFSLEIGPLPRKRHRWPSATRAAHKVRASQIARGFGPAARLVKESASIPGAWAVNSVHANIEEPTHVRVLPGAPRPMKHGYSWETDWPSRLSKDSLPVMQVPIHAGTWGSWLWWRVEDYLIPQALPAVLQRCVLTSVTVTRSGIRTQWQPNDEVWRRNE